MRYQIKILNLLIKHVFNFFIKISGYWFIQLNLKLYSIISNYKLQTFLQSGVIDKEYKSGVRKIRRALIIRTKSKKIINVNKTKDN